MAVLFWRGGGPSPVSPRAAFWSLPSTQVGEHSAASGMDDAKSKTIFFKRSHFATHLPADALFSPSHYWLRREADGIWRVGFSKFAVRMLGDLVDQAFETPEGTAVQPGTI